MMNDPLPKKVNYQPHAQFTTMGADSDDVYLRTQRVTDGLGGCHLRLHCGEPSRWSRS